MKKIAVFDFTGTICEAYHFIFSALRSESIKQGYISSSVTPPSKTMGVKELFHFFNVPTDKIKETSFKVIQKMEDNIESFQPVPRIVSTLQNLKENGVELYLASSNSERAIQQFISNHNINIFSKVCSSLGKDGKKNLAIELSEKFPGAKIFIVGDEERDIEALPSQENIFSVGVSWGFENPSSWAESPNFIAKTSSDLPRIILGAN